MTTRTAIVLDNISGQTGTIPLDITMAEIAVANITGLVFWPYIDATYGRVPGSAPQALYDRLTDASLTTVAATSFAITTLPDSTPSVTIASQNTCWRAVSKFTGGATFAAKVTNLIAISSNAAAAGSTYWLRDDGAGKLTFRVGAYTWDSANYDGPTLTAGAATAIVFRIDTLTGTVTLKVGNTYTKTIQNDAMRNITLHQNYQFGLVNNEGTLTSKFSNYGHLLAFTTAVTDNDLTKILAMME